MAEKHGALSINSDNIFPIIKKWLYSDHDIFYRELISNGCDAITKLKKLDMMGEYELPEGYKPRVDVIVDPDAKTIQFIDNGVGMTAEKAAQILSSNDDNSADFFREIGVSNVHKRLQYQFGAEYGITIESKEGEYTTMSIHIPNIIFKADENV